MSRLHVPVMWKDAAGSQTEERWREKNRKTGIMSKREMPFKEIMMCTSGTCERDEDDDAGGRWWWEREGGREGGRSCWLFWCSWQHGGNLCTPTPPSGSQTLFLRLSVTGTLSADKHSLYSNLRLDQCLYLFSWEHICRRDLFCWDIRVLLFILTVFLNKCFRDKPGSISIISIFFLFNFMWI